MHAYEIRVKSSYGTIEFIRIEARNRSSAAKKAEKLGWTVLDVNMIG